MVKEFYVNGIRWLHVTKPDKKDTEFIQSTFKFHPLVLDSIASPTLHPFLEDFDDHLFLVLHFPVIYHSHQPNKAVEIDFLITKNLLVTVTFTEFSRLDEIFDAVKNDTSLRQNITKHHTGFLLYFVVDRLFQGLVADLDFMEKQTMKIEDKVFQTHGKLTVEQISHVRRDILDFRRPVRAQASVFAAFAEKGQRFFGKTMSPYLADLVGTEERVRTLVENQKETMDVLHETHESLLSARMSRIIATLTIFSAVILPLSFLASIWGMNQRVMPLRDHPNDFWIVLGIMGAVAAGLLMYFRQKKWL